MRWAAIRKLLTFSLLSSVVIWSFLGVTQKEVTQANKYQTTTFIRRLKTPGILWAPSKEDARTTTANNGSERSYRSDIATAVTESKSPHKHRLHLAATKATADYQDQFRQEIYGNNYLEELVFVGANTDLLYGTLVYRQQFGSCINEEVDCSESPLLNLLKRGFRYFELTAHFDRESRFYYWYLSNEDFTRREMSRDVREICPFVRNNSGEMFIFSISFCSTDCEEMESSSIPHREVETFVPEYPDRWTSLYKGPAESEMKQHKFNDSFHSNPSFRDQKLGFIGAWFSDEKPLIENPVASRFLGIVASYVKNCALTGDVPLTRTVAEMLMLGRNAIFTVRKPNFLVPLALQRVFRRDEILRKTIWSDGSIGTRPGHKISFEWIFPDLDDTKSLRFFTQPSTLSHLKLIFSDGGSAPWLSRWKGVMTFPSGCTVFDVSLLLLMACLILIVLKGSLRQNTLRGIRFDRAAGKVYPLKRSPSMTSTSSSPSLAMVYLLYATFFTCFLLANLYAYQCFPRVILPFGHQEVDTGLSTSGNNLSGDPEYPRINSNVTSENAALQFLSPDRLREEVCNSIIWTFRRWIERPYGKRVNIISAVTKSLTSSSSSKSSLMTVLQDPLLTVNVSSTSFSSSLLGMIEFDVCTREFVEFSRKVNYNQLRKHVLLRHEGTSLPGRTNRKHSTPPNCRSVGFAYSVSSGDQGDLLSGTVDEGEEVIFEEGNFPKDSVLSVRIVKQNVSRALLLYSEVLEKLVQSKQDVFLRGSRTGSTSGFAYASLRSDLTVASCAVGDLPRSSDLLRVTSWKM